MLPTQNITTSNTTDCPSSAPYLIYGNEGAQCHHSCMDDGILRLILVVLAATNLGVAIGFNYLAINALNEALENNTSTTRRKISTATILTGLGIVGCSAYLVYDSLYMSAKHEVKNGSSYHCVSDAVNYNACISDQAACNADIWLLLVTISMFIVTPSLTASIALAVVRYCQNPAESFRQGVQAIRNMANCLSWKSNNPLEQPLRDVASEQITEQSITYQITQ